MTVTTKPLGIIACGALSLDLARSLELIGVEYDLHPLPPVLHNRPERIAPAVEAKIQELRPKYRQLALGYADCGTYGAIDELCERYDLMRLPGQHCYDLFAGPTRIAKLLDEEPGTYLLTDFLVAGFDRLVWQELGLDRHPQLRDDYFGNYHRVVWLAAQRTPQLQEAADQAAERLGLPLQVVEINAAGNSPDHFTATLKTVTTRS